MMAIQLPDMRNGMPICALSEPPSSGTAGDNVTEGNYLTFSRWGIPEITDPKFQLIDSTWQVLQLCRGTRNAYENNAST